MGVGFDITPIKTRLKEYLDFEGLNNSRFEKRCGLYNGFVKDMDTQIKFESLGKIAEGCPNLNLGWLFSGVGQMTIGGQPAIQAEPTSAIEVSVVKSAGAVIISDATRLESLIQDAVTKALKRS